MSCGTVLKHVRNTWKSDTGAVEMRATSNVLVLIHAALKRTRGEKEVRRN
jgi:hypothetical protein